MNSAQEKLLRSLPLGRLFAFAARDRDGLGRDDRRLRCVPALIDQQRLGLGCGRPRLREELIDRVPIFVARGDLPGERQYEVVTVVSEGGKPVYRQVCSSLAR